VYDHRNACGGETFRDRRADALRGASHDCHLTGQVAHLNSPVLPTLRQLDNRRSESVKAAAGSDLYFRKPVEIGAQDPALQHKVCELAFAQDLDQAGGFELLDVMGEGRGADPLALVQGAARCRGGVLADLLEDLNAPRLGERAGNARELALG